MKALREHQKRMLAEGNWRADGYLFCNIQGGPLRKSNFLRRDWHPFCERPDLFKEEPVIDRATGQPVLDPETSKPKTRKVFPRFHATRHTAATMHAWCASACRAGTARPFLHHGHDGHL